MFVAALLTGKYDRQLFVVLRPSHTRTPAHPLGTHTTHTHTHDDGAEIYALPPGNPAFFLSSCQRWLSISTFFLRPASVGSVG